MEEILSSSEGARKPNRVRVCTLYSGSTGNCTYVASERTKILVDAGKSARALCLALRDIGSDISEIDAIFITHEHTDHVSALETLSKKHHIPIHAAKACADHISRPGSCVASCVVSHSPIFTVELDGISVSSFLTSHDSRCPVGYKIVTEDGDSCGVATDTGIVTRSTAEALKGCRAVVLECNHDKHMLAVGPYPPYLKERIASRYGHLSNDDCARLVSYLAECGTSSFILAHLSEENNTKELALDTVRGAVQGDGISISVSDPDAPTFMD